MNCPASKLNSCSSSNAWRKFEKSHPLPITHRPDSGRSSAVTAQNDVNLVNRRRCSGRMGLGTKPLEELEARIGVKPTNKGLAKPPALSLPPLLTRRLYAGPSFARLRRRLAAAMSTPADNTKDQLAGSGRLASAMVNCTLLSTSPCVSQNSKVPLNRSSQYSGGAATSALQIERVQVGLPKCKRSTAIHVITRRAPWN